MDVVAGLTPTLKRQQETSVLWLLLGSIIFKYWLNVKAPRAPSPSCFCQNPFPITSSSHCMLGQTDCGLWKCLELGGVQLKYFTVKGQKFFIWKIMNVEFFLTAFSRGLGLQDLNCGNHFCLYYQWNSTFPSFIINEIRGALLHLVQMLFCFTACHFKLSNIYLPRAWL